MFLLLFFLVKSMFSTKPPVNRCLSRIFRRGSCCYFLGTKNDLSDGKDLILK